MIENLTTKSSQEGTKSTMTFFFVPFAKDIPSGV